MLELDYPILPLPALSWANAAQYLVEGIPCTLYPPKYADLLANIPKYVAEKNTVVRFALASTVQETLPHVSIVTTKTTIHIHVC